MLAVVTFLCAFGPEASFAQAPSTIVVPSGGGEPWTPEEIAKLDTGIDGIISAPSLRGAHVGVLALDSSSGKILYARNADDAFQPASTLKLLVGSVALEKLGADYRFHTQLETSAAEPDALLLRAGGDPFLARGDLDAAAAAVATAAIAPVRDVYVDDSHDDDIPYAPGWTWDDFAYDYAARISAMTFEENVVHLSVTPGSVVGSSAVVRADAPALLGSEFTSSAQTGDTRTPSTIDVRVGGPACLEVTGSIPLGGSAEALDGAVCDPAAYARLALLRLLHARGVAVADASQTQTQTQPRPQLQTKPQLQTQPQAQSQSPAPGLWGDAVRPTGPGARVLWQHDSAELATWLGSRFWIPSDNLVAELLLKEIGYAAAGAPGSDEKGIAFETAWLRTLGVDPSTVTLADGSGLSQYDRITPRDLVAILQHDWNGPNRRLILDSLPVGGARGTVEGIAGTPAAGRVFAKTGSMMHVRGLAGFVATRRHGAVTFAFNVDDWLGEYPALALLRARVLSRIVSD